MWKKWKYSEAQKAAKKRKRTNAGTVHCQDDVSQTTKLIRGEWSRRGVERRMCKEGGAAIYTTELPKHSSQYESSWANCVIITKEFTAPEMMCVAFYLFCSSKIFSLINKQQKVFFFFFNGAQIRCIREVQRQSKFWSILSFYPWIVIISVMPKFWIVY